MPDTRFFKKTKSFNLKELASIAEAEIFENSDPNFLVENVSPLDNAKENEISFLSNKKYIQSFKTSKAGACIIEVGYENLAPKNMHLLISKNSYKSYALVAEAFYPTNIEFREHKSPNCYIADNVIIGKNCYIGHGAVIEDNVNLGNNVYIGANTVICKGVVIGDNCYIAPSVTITHAIIGKNAIVHSGVRIGQDGFGFVQAGAGHMKVPQLGKVIIGNFVEIGSNSTIDRGAGPDTIISDFCKIDNLVQIGHNVKLGIGCIIVAQVGIAGSTNLGNFVVVGGQVGIAGHLNIGDQVQIAAQSGVMINLAAKEIVGGSPSMPIKQWHRTTIAIKKLINTKKDNG